MTSQVGPEEEYVTIEAQGTVHRFDDESRSGSVLLDDGTELAFDSGAFDHGDLRHVRFGQRVRLGLSDDSAQPTVAWVTLITFPAPR